MAPITPTNMSPAAYMLRWTKRLKKLLKKGLDVGQLGAVGIRPTMLFEVI